MPDRLLSISFSGGETSAWMTKRLLEEKRKDYDAVRVLFANTGEENEATLQFVHQCDVNFGFKTVWVEAMVDPRPGKGIRHKVVDFNSASRKGEPFEAMIVKYGIPNQMFPKCTNYLKQYPMESYLKSIGWFRGEFDVAIGIRADEPSRRSGTAAQNRIIYPFLDLWPTTKVQVNTFWNNQPFRLDLKGYQGNCKWCWKKSLRKHMTILSDNPEFFDFPERMEREYGHVKTQVSVKKDSQLPPEGYKRTFFRTGLSVLDLKELHKKFDPRNKVGDDSIIYEDDENSNGGCSESCEVDWENKDDA